LFFINAHAPEVINVTSFLLGWVPVQWLSFERAVPRKAQAAIKYYITNPVACVCGCCCAWMMQSRLPLWLSLASQQCFGLGRVFFRVCVLAPDLGGVVLLGVFCISIRCRSLQLPMTSRKAMYMCAESSNLSSTMLELDNMYGPLFSALSASSNNASCIGYSWSTAHYYGSP
jgi:hypothetical protein